MGQVEAQRAIIEGSDFMYPSKIFEVREYLAIPSNEDLLTAYDPLTILTPSGRWISEDGKVLFEVVLQHNNIRPRTMILEDGRIFRKRLPEEGWLPYDPDMPFEKKYEEEVLKATPFDFEAIWERVGQKNNQEAL